MQGRFTNKGGFFPQQFPWENWKEEFYTAERYGIDCIEWMFNHERFYENPIWTEWGRREIKETVSISGIRICSICANYFMQDSIYNESEMDIFQRLIEAGAELGICRIVIPLFEASGIGDLSELHEKLETVKEYINGTGICIALESDSSAGRQKRLCELLNSAQIGICYDVGNAAGNGYDYLDDISEIKKYLLEVHLKDKKYKGTSVMLGEGAVDFKNVFHTLTDWGQGNFVLESYFGKDAVRDTSDNIKYIRGISNG